jgi:cytochrome c-type biogenesis protein CcmE
MLIAAIVVLAAFGYFAFTAFESATTYYLTVDEVVEQQTQLLGETFQMKGQLVPASFSRQKGTLLANFRIGENGAEVDAAYEGVLPDLFFSEHSEIVLHGQFEQSGVFTVDRILVKCPSKYQTYDEVPERYFTNPVS